MHCYVTGEVALCSTSKLLSVVWAATKCRGFARVCDLIADRRNANPNCFRNSFAQGEGRPEVKLADKTDGAWDAIRTWAWHINTTCKRRGKTDGTR